MFYGCSSESVSKIAYRRLGSMIIIVLLVLNLKRKFTDHFSQQLKVLDSFHLNSIKVYSNFFLLYCVYPGKVSFW